MSVSDCSKRCPSTPSTTSPYIWISRRYESYAKRSLPVVFASPATASSLRPRLRIVSIIPGIETAAPERTETSSGSSGSPKRFPAFASSEPMCFATSASSPSGRVPFAAMYARHASVVIVKPAGTDTPSAVISASPIPLPPRSSRPPPPESSSKS
jgi:hypothetical protein